MRRLVVASLNPKKVVELERLLAGLPFQLCSLADVEGAALPEESGSTFEANARLKALSAAAATGALSLADDSGLAVDALGGRPGVRSARYAGEGADDAANNALLLKELQDVPDTERTAAFVCCIAIAEPGQVVYVAEGRVAGRIAFRPAGPPDAFGYDPLFIPKGEVRSFAQMRPEEKDAVSHRARALTKAHAFLKSLT